MTSSQRPSPKPSHLRSAFPPRNHAAVVGRDAEKRINRWRGMVRVKGCFFFLNKGDGKEGSRRKDMLVIFWEAAGLCE